MSEFVTTSESRTVTAHGIFNNNIMEPILVRHKYTRAYKDGEKHHMPVAMYKRAMAEKDAIVEEAKAEAEQMVDEAYDEMLRIAEEKEQIIQGTGMSGRDGVPYEEWSLEDLSYAHRFYTESRENETNIEYMSVPQLEKVQEELISTVKGTQTEYEDMSSKYARLRDGYVNSDGKHILGYNELIKRHKELLQDPAKLLETEEGQQVLEEAKEEIVESVQKNLITNMLGFIKREIFDTLKEWLVEPIYDAIDEMMRGHYFKLNDSDKRILTGAIDRTVDRLVDRLDIGSKIEDNIRENMPSENQIEHEVQRAIRGRRR